MDRRPDRTEHVCCRANAVADSFTDALADTPTDCFAYGSPNGPAHGQPHTRADAFVPGWQVS